ncbi:hypothetical protein C922_00637 [Plasmodium inui San Antonio 1]|uniref:PUB domain-containing protein n=1 Tax=Plasmodium inui San Antonio 1 TaxID=1237626 RepID=W7AU41_9APIC|nr:hypothetical protein C922_00637 [Plasmodium inui San Antonio 1]EUD68946.1 hypothetical protein C922_00637 [Plasmodium inui San Antonio 1]
MKFEECLQLLGEKFPHVDPKRIEDKTKLYLIRKAETCHSEEEENFQIDDKSVEELIRIFYAEGGERKDHVGSPPDKMHMEDAAHSREGDKKEQHNSSRHNAESSPSRLEVGVKKDQSIDVAHERPHPSKVGLAGKDKNAAKDSTRSDRARDPGILHIDKVSGRGKDKFVRETPEGSSNELKKTGTDGKKRAENGSGVDTTRGAGSITNSQKDGRGNNNKKGASNKENNGASNKENNGAANEENNWKQRCNSKGASNSRTVEAEKREDALTNEAQKEKIAGMCAAENSGGAGDLFMGEAEGVGKNISEKVNALETPNSADAPSTTLFEVLFRKSLLENDNIKRNISSKNFYIIGEDMLINITIILDRLISELISHYRVKKVVPSEQEQHFENFFNVLYKLLSNISYNSKEEKYKIIKFSNSQIKTSFLTNFEIFNLTKLLFEILNFNTSSYGVGISLPSEDPNARPEQMGEDIIASSPYYVDMIWKFEDPFTDKESILFEFVLTSINIIMIMINKKVPRIRMSNEKIFPSDGKVKIEQRVSQESEISKKSFEDPKKYLEKLSNNISPINNKLLIIHQKNKQEQQALSDIRKLHNEKYAVHKNYANGTVSSSGKNSHGASSRNNTSTVGRMCSLNGKKKNYSADNCYCTDNELGDKNSIKKSTKKIKHFFKNLFKKG